MVGDAHSCLFYCSFGRVGNHVGVNHSRSSQVKSGRVHMYMGIFISLSPSLSLSLLLFRTCTTERDRLITYSERELHTILFDTSSIG